LRDYGRASGKTAQIEAVKSLVYHRKDTVLVAATGFGKSAVLYAVGALSEKKITIQIVPLSKLGQNQCEDIKKNVPGSTPVFVDGDTPVTVGITLASYYRDFS
jgi:superfamily II DNA helicase RecQ